MTALLAPITILLGLAAIAGALYLLQRLRVRHRPVRVISTLFWRAAVEEARARVLVERFRHPLVYLLLLFICSLLWLAVAGVDRTDLDGRRHVVLVEASAAAGVTEESLARALDAVERLVTELPRARRQVILCAESPTSLLAPGEPARLLSLRRAALAPVPAPSSVAATIAASQGTLSPGEGSLVWVAGAVALPDLALPAGVECVAVPGSSSAERPNRAITACGVSPARSGAWDRVDLLVEVSGVDPAGAALSLTLDGRPPEGEVERRLLPPEEGGGVHHLLRDVPARGQRLVATLVGAGDGNPLDDEAARVLPRRRLLRVSLDPGLAPWLAPVLEADPAVTLVESAPDVFVGREGAAPDEVPALTFRPRSSQEESILLSHADDEDSAAILAAALVDLGLDQVDAMELAAATGTPITLGARPAPRREIGVWEELLAEEYNFVTSRSFPLFVALALRWILEVEESPAEIAAGRPLPGARSLRRRDAADAPVLDPLGGVLAPPRAGEYLDEEGGEVAVPLLPPRRLGGVLDAVPPNTVLAGGVLATAGTPPGSTRAWPVLLGLLALGALLFEWLLLRKGELP